MVTFKGGIEVFFVSRQDGADVSLHAFMCVYVFSLHPDHKSPTPDYNRSMCHTISYYLLYIWRHV